MGALITSRQNTAAVAPPSDFDVITCTAAILFEGDGRWVCERHTRRDGDKSVPRYLSEKSLTTLLQAPEELVISKTLHFRAAAPCDGPMFADYGRVMIYESANALTCSVGACHGHRTHQRRGALLDLYSIVHPWRRWSWKPVSHLGTKRRHQTAQQTTIWGMLQARAIRGAWARDS